MLSYHPLTKAPQAQPPNVSISNRTRRPISGEEEHFLLEFAHFLSGVRSAASIAAYQSDIRLFAENMPGVDLLRIANQQEDNYLARLKELGFKRRTLSRKGTAFRYFRQFVSGKRLAGESLNPGAEPSSSAGVKLGTKCSVFNEESEIDQGLSAFLRSVEETRSHSTVRAYRCDLLKFRSSLQNTEKWHQVTKQLISDFLDQQIAAGLNANSTARVLSTIRSLFVWLREKSYLIGNPALSLQTPRGGKKASIPTIADLNLIGAADIPTEFSALRDRLVFELLYRCGLRASEISSLNVISVDLKRKRLVVQGRRDRRRYINLAESLIGIIAAYLSRQKAMGDEDSALVVNLRGSRLTARSIGRIVDRLAAAHKLPEGTHPHTLRHAYASHGIKSGKDVQDIRHDLGVSGVSAVLKISN
jgi:integrase/recombinase XerC